MRTEEPVKSVQSVNRTLFILEFLAMMSDGASLTDISRASELPAPTARRLLSTLAAKSYVQQDEGTRRYRLGAAAARLARFMPTGSEQWPNLIPVELGGQDATLSPDGSIVVETSIGSAVGAKGYYHYRQYSATELAEVCTLEDVWFLFLEHRLPSSSESADFARNVRHLREIPNAVASLLPSIAAAQRRSGPLESLRTAVSLLGGSEGFRSGLETDRAELRHQAMQVSAVVPTIVAALYRLNAGKAPIAPHPDLGHTANFIYMLDGQEPSPERCRAVEKYLISTIDFGFNPPTFAGRVASSAGADLAGAVVASIGAFSSPYYSGVSVLALETLDAIGTPENAEAWTRSAIMRGTRISGFGHRYYAAHHPRALLLRNVARELGGDLVDFAEVVATTVERVVPEMKPGRSLQPNGEYYSAVIMELCGIPRSLFSSAFVSGRIIGWCAHIVEQASDNRIIRPSAHYIGPPPIQPVVL